MLAARPNLNGNSAEDFRRAGLRLLAAREAVAAALGAVRTDVLHGRNYQTVPFDRRAAGIAADRQLLEEAARAVVALDRLAAGIAEALDALEPACA